MIDGQWFIEHGIEQGDEAVIEWTMTWRDPRSGDERLDRGTEWFQMRDGKIAEVRAYHHGGKKNPQGDLLGLRPQGPRLHDARGLEGAPGRGEAEGRRRSRRRPAE